MTEQQDGFELLAAYVAGELDADQCRAMESRLADDATLRAEVERVRQVLDTLRGDDLVMPRQELIDKASALFRQQRPAATESVLDHASRVLARLVFDSRAQPVLPGFRGAGDGYHLMYASELGDVDLQVLPAADPAKSLLQVRGQVAAEQAADAFVQLRPVGDEHAVLQTRADERGRFTLESDPGRYDVQIQLGKRALVVEDVRFA